MPSEDIHSPADRPSESTDAELMLALRAGNTAALGTLYDRHAGLVYGVALRVLRDAQEAEDLAHDIFVRLAHTTAYDPTRGVLRTFLAVLTRSRAIDRVRSRSTRSRILQKQASEAQQETDDNRPLESVFRHELSEEMQAALAQLTQEQREVLQLIYYEGLSQSEIARRLDLPLGTVKSRGRRGLLKLRELI